MNHASTTFNNYLVHQLAELTTMLRLTGYTVEAGELAAELYHDERLKAEQYRAAGVQPQHEGTGAARRTTFQRISRAHQSRLQALLVSRRLLAEIIRACPRKGQSLEAMAAELQELEWLFEVTLTEVREARTHRMARAEQTTSPVEREYRRSLLATACEMRQAIVEHKAQLDTYKKLPPRFSSYRSGQPDRAAGNVAEALTTIIEVLQQPSVPVDDTDMPAAPPTEQRDAQVQARATPIAIPLTVTGLAEATGESESTIRKARTEAGIKPWPRGHHGICFSPEQVRQIAEQRFSSPRCNRDAWNQLLKDINQPPVS